MSLKYVRTLTRYYPSPRARVPWQHHLKVKSKTERQTNKQTRCAAVWTKWCESVSRLVRSDCSAQYCNITDGILQFTVNKQTNKTEQLTVSEHVAPWDVTRSHDSRTAGFVTAATIAVVLPGRQRDRSVSVTTLETTKAIQRGCTWTRQLRVRNSYMGESECLKGVFLPKFPVVGLRKYTFTAVLTQCVYFFLMFIEPCIILIVE